MSILKKIIAVQDDYGDAILVNGVPFQKTEMSLDYYSYSLSGSDITFISGVTFDYDDNFENNGTAHKQWSAYEIAIASLPENCSKVWIHPNYNDNITKSNIINISNDLDKNLEYKVKHAGVARIIIGPTLSSASQINVILNGLIVRVLSSFSTRITMNQAIPILVDKDDIIRIPNVYSRIIILPFEYNTPISES